MLREFLYQYLPEAKLKAIRRREQREKAEIEKLADYSPVELRKLVRHQAEVQSVLRGLR